MDYLLIATDENLYAAWQVEFSNYHNVSIQHCSIFDLSADAIVSPANSFGIMDGGLDGKLRDFFGMEIENRVRRQVKERYSGEVPVGCAFSVLTNHPQFTYLISAPTMRVPEDVATSVNAYLAMRAILIEAKTNPEINSVAIPGLCSLSGRMPLNVVARQMRVAFDVIETKKISYSHWREEKQLQNYMHCRTNQLPDDLER